MYNFPSDHTRLNPPGFTRSTIIVAIVILTILITGCSTYQNITGYFNTYYNAKKLFDEAVAEVENSPLRARDTLYFIGYAANAGPDAKFDKVIEKCSKIIQFYENSSWVDDAILMIGISYVYKGESESAVRKFVELEDKFPNSNLLRKTKLWQAKAEYFMRKEDDALKITKDLFDEARAEGDNDVLFELLMLEGQIAFDREEYDIAAGKYQLASETSVDDNLRGKAKYLCGIAYERSGDAKKAAEAYGAVRNFHPPFALEFQSRLKYGMMLTKSQQHDRSIAALSELLEEQLKAEERGLIDLEIANAHWEKGDTAEAFALYRLIDTTFAHTDASAKDYFQLGRIYEQHFLDFSTAKTYYSKAKDEFAGSDVTPLAQKKAATLSNYFVHYDNIIKYDSLLVVSLHRDSVNAAAGQSKSSVDSVSPSPVASREDSSVSPRDTMNTATSPLAETPPPPENAMRTSVDSSKLPAQALSDENGDDEQEFGRRHETRRIVSRRTAPEMSSHKPGSRQTVTDSLASARTRPDSSKRGAANVPASRSPELLSTDSLQTLLAQTKFELGGILLLELNLPDSATTWYHDVMQKHPDAPVVPRTIYALAEVNRLKNDTSAVQYLYQVLLNRYGNSEYAAQARKLLGLLDEEKVKDSALVQFEQGEHLLEDGKGESAVQAFKHVVTRFPNSPLKPKAMYTIGWIYENVLVNNDRAAVWYQRVVKEYPASLYAADVQPRLAVKADPKALSQYIKVNEIQSIQPQGAPRSSTDVRRAAPKDPSDEEIQNGKRLHQKDQEEDQDDQEEDTTDEDDSDNN